MRGKFAKNESNIIQEKAQFSAKRYNYSSHLHILKLEKIDRIYAKHCCKLSDFYIFAEQRRMLYTSIFTHNILFINILHLSWQYLSFLSLSFLSFLIFGYFSPYNKKINIFIFLLQSKFSQFLNLTKMTMTNLTTQKHSDYETLSFPKKG